jgi:hypothetical protein
MQEGLSPERKKAKNIIAIIIHTEAPCLHYRYSVPYGKELLAKVSHAYDAFDVALSGSI